MTRFLSFICVLFAIAHIATAQTPQDIQYAYPVHYLSLKIEAKDVKMAYMDVHPTKPNGKNILLLHGKNFNGYYWKDVTKFLAARGYRVIVPDQVGWGKSSTPDIHYSFHLLAANTKKLLDTLGVDKIIVLGHSMGGMLATRFALMYPYITEKLILEDPIGLEDYKTFVPYQSLDKQYKQELSQTYTSYKKYQQDYYPEWKPEYEDLVRVQAAALNSPEFKKIAFANAITYEMIYDQPVCYEFSLIKTPTLVIVGMADRTIVGKNLLSEEMKNQHGQYSMLGKKTAGTIPNARLVELPGVGHIPHIQDFDEFSSAFIQFIEE